VVICSRLRLARLACLACLACLARLAESDSIVWFVFGVFSILAQFSDRVKINRLIYITTSASDVYITADSGGYECDGICDVINVEMRIIGAELLYLERYVCGAIHVEIMNA